MLTGVFKVLLSIKVVSVICHCIERFVAMFTFGPSKFSRPKRYKMFEETMD